MIKRKCDILLQSVGSKKHFNPLKFYINFHEYSQFLPPVYQT